MPEQRTYRDGYQEGWQKVTERPMQGWPTLRQGYERGLADGQDEAERLLRSLGFSAYDTR